MEDKHDAWRELHTLDWLFCIPYFRLAVPSQVALKELKRHLSALAKTAEKPRPELVTPLYDDVVHKMEDKHDAWRELRA